MTTRIAVLITAGTVLFAGGCAKPPVDENIVVVHVGAGNWAEANLEAYVRPFEQATGIKVIGIADDLKTSNLKLMHDSGNVEIDIISLPAIDAARAAQLGLLANIDYSIYDQREIAGLKGDSRKPWGVGALYYSMVIGYDMQRFAAPDAAPRTWRDFWDVEKFPGARTLYTGQYGDGPWEEALVADGVAIADLYPLDIDRAFRVLERIRPHVAKWWRVGSEGQQLLRDRQVTVGQAFDGRIVDLQSSGNRIGFDYEQGKLLLDYWVIPAKSPHLANAQKFIEFATRARQQALFAQRIAYGPTNLGAYEYIPVARARSLASHPNNLARQIQYDVDWYVTEDANGVANVEKLIQRWNEWILE
jgi:putative spermidine/putrescine transport system substrate-binding protein